VTAGATVALLAPAARGVLSGGFLVNRALGRSPAVGRVNATSAAELERALDRGSDATPVVDSLYLFHRSTALVLERAASRRPVVLLAHSLPSLIPGPAPAARREMIEIEQGFLSAACGAVAPSRFMAGALERRGLASAAVAVAEPAPVCDGRSTATRRERPADAGDEVRILTIANRTRAKGILDAAEAVRRVGLEGIPWRWTIVGSRDSDPELAVEFDSYVRDHRLADRITELPPQAPETLHERYGRADAFLLPSYMESYGLVFAEAITFGVPTIGYRCGGVPEAVGDAGLLVSAGAVDALAGAIVAAARGRGSGGRGSGAHGSGARGSARLPSTRLTSGGHKTEAIRRRAASLPDRAASVAAFLGAVDAVIASGGAR